MASRKRVRSRPKQRVTPQTSPVRAPVVPSRPVPSRPPVLSWTCRLAPLVVAVVAALAFVNAAPDVAIHDDTFFVPSRFRLDGESLLRMFTQDAWSATGAPA